MVGCCFVLKFVETTRVFARKHGLCYAVSKIEALDTAQVLAVAVLAYEGGIHLTRIFQDELLDSRVLTRTGIPDFMELLEK